MCVAFVVDDVEKHVHGRDRVVGAFELDPRRRNIELLEANTGETVTEPVDGDRRQIGPGHVRRAEFAPELDIEARAAPNVQYSRTFEINAAADCAPEYPATDGVKPTIERLTQTEPAHPFEGEGLLKPV